MTKEEAYLEHKKNTVISIVRAYNKNNSYNNQFIIDSNNLDLEKTFCNPERCKECGECCKAFPCVFSPYDFLDIDNMDYMRNILNTGLVCIDTISLGCLTLRPRGKEDKKGILSLIDQENPCLLQSRNGCLLPTMYRPSEGLLLYCTKEEIRQLYEDPEIVREYEKHQRTMRNLLDEFEKQTIPFDVIHDSKNGYIHYKEEDVQQLTKRLAGY